MSERPTWDDMKRERDGHLRYGGPTKPPQPPPRRTTIYPPGLNVEAGAPYRPSNGSEGEMFSRARCERCTKDLHGPEDGCPIIVAVLCFYVDDDGYPPEWVWGADGQPMCSAYDPLWPTEESR